MDFLGATFRNVEIDTGEGYFRDEKLVENGT